MFHCSTKSSPLIFSQQQPYFHANNCPFCGIIVINWPPSGQEANNVHPGFSLLTSACLVTATLVWPVWNVHAYAFACVVAIWFAMANISHKRAQRCPRSEGRRQVLIQRNEEPFCGRVINDHDQNTESGLIGFQLTYPHGSLLTERG